MNFNLFDKREGEKLKMEFWKYWIVNAYTTVDILSMMIEIQCHPYFARNIQQAGFSIQAREFFQERKGVGCQI